MYQAFYRKYRPKTFDDVIGQDVIVRTLKNAIIKNQISHAYLFSGQRGTGKTSIAKVFAKAINCENNTNGNSCEQCSCCTSFNEGKNIDIIEIDAASNNGVEEIRNLISKVNLVPSMSKYKIYIIDEVHMLSTNAFNAFLKTIEEPPKHVIFIFATTEPQKVISTILSRCQRYDFKKISDEKIKERLQYVCAKENIKATDSALLEIARLSGGGLRDAISILDQVVAYMQDEINLEDVHEINGTITQNGLKELISYITKKDLNAVICLINKYDNEGKNFAKLIDEVIIFYKNILLLQNKALNIDSETYEEFTKIYNENEIIEIINLFSNINVKSLNNPRMIFEIIVIKIISYLKKDDNNAQINTKKIIEPKESIKKSNFLDKVRQIKQVRIENTLAKIDKTKLTEYRNIIESLKLQTDAEYTKEITKLKDTELKASSDVNLIFVAKTENMANSFNEDILKIEKYLQHKMPSKCKIICIPQIEWEIIKKEYSNKKGQYIYKNDDLVMEELEMNNDIDKSFKDIVEYE
jgi:DNA polymerase-3 subunit gamma/tau